MKKKGLVLYFHHYKQWMTTYPDLIKFFFFYNIFSNLVGISDFPAKFIRSKNNNLEIKKQLIYASLFLNNCSSLNLKKGYTVL